MSLPLAGGDKPQQFEAGVNSLLQDAHHSAAVQAATTNRTGGGHHFGGDDGPQSQPSGSAQGGGAGVGSGRAGHRAKSIGPTDAERIESDRKNEARDYELFNTPW
jgi:hypothetical protein